MRSGQGCAGGGGGERWTASGKSGLIAGKESYGLAKRGVKKSGARRTNAEGRSPDDGETRAQATAPEIRNCWGRVDRSSKNEKGRVDWTGATERLRATVRRGYGSSCGSGGCAPVEGST